MGNALCGIVPTDMVCHREEPNEMENEKNLTCLKHYNSQIVDKRLAIQHGMSLYTHNNNNRTTEMNENYRNLAVSMPERYALEPNNRPPYSLNNQNIYVN